MEDEGWGKKLQVECSHIAGSFFLPEVAADLAQFCRYDKAANLRLVRLEPGHSFTSNRELLPSFFLCQIE